MNDYFREWMENKVYLLIYYLYRDVFKIKEFNGVINIKMFLDLV